jgi:Tol biopolymer transport system component
MKWFNDSKTMSLLLAFVVALMLTAPSVNADFTFGKPVNLGPNINSSSLEVEASISVDGLELLFESWRPGGHGNADIYVSRRASKDDPWGPSMNIGAPVNTAYYDQSPSISADGLSLYFSCDRPGGYGIDDLWVTTRASVSDPWGPPVNLGATVNSSDYDCMPSISTDGLVLFFMSGRAGGVGGDDLWFTSRATKNDPWRSPVNLGGPISSSFNEALPDISADGRMLFFSDHMLAPFRPGGYGGQDIWVTARATTDDPWGEPMNLGPVINSSDWEFSPNISGDGSTLYFASMPPGGTGNADLWQSPTIPVVDFNGDGIVDLKDFSKLAQYWGQNESSVDMGPMPWGDGTVDIQDVAVLAGYWLKEFGLFAHWKLDETEGFIAHDSAGDHKGFVLVQNPLWRPTGGRIAGALELDGIDDSVSAPFVLNPAEGAFSVFAWIKGGSPGQVIISQTGGTGTGATWLGTGLSDGALISALVSPGRFGSPLASNAVITDGQWHRIGLVWDGSYRTLYVDEIEAAKDAQAQSQPISANGGLYFGVGKDRAVGSFWSGLIDDVRIYDRAITP